MDTIFHSSTGIEDEARRLAYVAEILRIDTTSPSGSGEKLGGQEMYEVAPTEVQKSGATLL